MDPDDVAGWVRRHPIEARFAAALELAELGVAAVVARLEQRNVAPTVAAIRAEAEELRSRGEDGVTPELLRAHATQLGEAAREALRMQGYEIG